MELKFKHAGDATQVLTNGIIGRSVVIEDNFRVYAVTVLEVQWDHLVVLCDGQRMSWQINDIQSISL